MIHSYGQPRFRGHFTPGGQSGWMPGSTPVPVDTYTPSGHSGWMPASSPMPTPAAPKPQPGPLSEIARLAASAQAGTGMVLSRWSSAQSSAAQAAQEANGAAEAFSAASSDTLQTDSSEHGEKAERHLSACYGALNNVTLQGGSGLAELQTQIDQLQHLARQLPAGTPLPEQIRNLTLGSAADTAPRVAQAKIGGLSDCQQAAWDAARVSQDSAQEEGQEGAPPQGGEDVSGSAQAGLAQVGSVQSELRKAQEALASGQDDLSRLSQGFALVGQLARG